MEIADIFSCVSSSATVVGVGAAVFALRSWKLQFKFQRKYECVLELRSQLHGANDAALYLSSLREHFSDCIRRGAEAELFEIDTFPYALQATWWNHLSELHRTWGLMEVTLSKAEIKGFSVTPGKLEDTMRQHVQEIVNLGCGEPTPKLFEINRLVSNFIRAVTDDYNTLEKDCRTVLSKLK